MKYMYRVSDMLRRREDTINSWTVVFDEFEQCGCLYYFSKLENACKAAIEFDNMVVPMVYCKDTRKSDDWYED